jgi:hypothetical protein
MGYEMMIKVVASKFHGGRIVYEGKSLQQAIRAARRIDCKSCKCGGPLIEREDGAILLNWHAVKPFFPANDYYWEHY